MLKKIVTLFSPTVDSLVAEVDSKVNRLVTLGHKKNATADTLHEQATALRARALASSAEADRAFRIAQRLNELVA